MKIGYVYDMHAYPTKGGNHRHAFELIDGFCERGHTVKVFDDPTMPKVRSFEKSELKLFLSDIDVLYIRIDGRSVKAQTSCELVMSQCPASVPIVWEINAPANESLAFSWLGGKTDSRVEPLWKRLKRFIHASKKLPAIFFEERTRKRLASNVDAAICVSSALVNYAKNGLGIAQSICMPNGGPLIPREEIELRRKSSIKNEFTVFYSGSAIYPWQGLDLLVSVAQLAQAENLPIRFVLAVNQAADLNYPSNLTILEGLGRDQILNEICTSDLCVSIHPEYPWSKWGFHNSPMKLFEYMGCATASLVSDHGQMNDLIDDGKNGYLTSNEPSAILKKIIEIKNNGDERARVGDAGYELIQSKMNWLSVVDQTLSILNKVIAAKK
jgi:glycosyltransferase involved in cell wall biosynthesis